MDLENTQNLKAYLLDWLQKVAAASSAEPKPLTISVYMETLVKWRLTESQWEELRERLKFAPRIGGKLPTLDVFEEEKREIVARDDGRAAAAKLKADMERWAAEAVPNPFPLHEVKP